MDITLGFPRKQELMDTVISRLTDVLKNTTPEHAELDLKDCVEDFNNEEDGDDVILSIHHEHFHWEENISGPDRQPDIRRIVDGNLLYTQRDHPLSQDGVAMIVLKFCIVYLNDDIYGERFFVDHALR